MPGMHGVYGHVSPAMRGRAMRCDAASIDRQVKVKAPDSTEPLSCLTPGVGGHDVATPMDSITASEEEVSENARRAAHADAVVRQAEPT